MLAFILNLEHKKGGSHHFFDDIGPRAAAMVPTACTSMQKAIANSVAATARRCFACSE